MPTILIIMACLCLLHIMVLTCYLMKGRKEKGTESLERIELDDLPTYLEIIVHEENSNPPPSYEQLFPENDHPG